MNAETADPAAIFAIATSLRNACENREKEDPSLNLGEAYNGWDQFTRELMRVASVFEDWACRHVGFEYFEHTWPYFLEDGFGEACLAAIDADALASFDEDDCLRVAFRLRLPVWENGSIPIPVDVMVENPLQGSAFRAFRIQTVRDHFSESTVIPFTETCDPFDEELGERYFGIYGVEDDVTIEHIADRRSFASARELVLKLATGAVCGEAVIGLHPMHF